MSNLMCLATIQYKYQYISIINVMIILQLAIIQYIQYCVIFSANTIQY